MDGPIHSSVAPHACSAPPPPPPPPFSLPSFLNGRLVTVPNSFIFTRQLFHTLPPFSPSQQGKNKEHRHRWNVWEEREGKNKGSGRVLVYIHGWTCWFKQFIVWPWLNVGQRWVAVPTSDTIMHNFWHFFWCIIIHNKPYKTLAAILSYRALKRLTCWAQCHLEYMWLFSSTHDLIY